MRVYQSSNILQYGATIHYQTQAVDTNHQAENLTTNLESRSSRNKDGHGNGWNARIDETVNGAEASYYSCYVTNSDDIANDGNIMKVVIDLKVKSFIHAVLIVDDLKDLWAWTYMSDSDKLSYLQNVEIYIGDDSEIASNNQICPGGPFLNLDDASNYSEDTEGWNINNLKPWNYGIETWCNLEGRFVHLQANLKHQAGQTFTQSICSLGIFGSIYRRNVEPPSKIEVL